MRYGRVQKVLKQKNKPLIIFAEFRSTYTGCSAGGSAPRSGRGVAGSSPVIPTTIFA